MAQLNRVARTTPVYTHGGARAALHVSPYNQLRRSVLSCLLWEKEFYENGQTIADRIVELCAKVTPEQLSALAIEARDEQHLRHIPLLLTAELAQRGGSIVADTLEKVIQRADELAEFLMIYWRNGKTPIAKQVKLGLARAFRKFNAYALSKYDREKDIRLRDVLFMIHAKPRDEAQAALWKQLVEGKLPTADTWETNLSAGKDPKETFERLIKENNLGYLALLRNLRTMEAANVDRDLIRKAIVARQGANKVLPFRYVAAARAAPSLAIAIDEALKDAVAESVSLPGRTVVLVDVSGSMNQALSGKSDLTRMDAAATLASVISGDIRMFSFSNGLREVPAYRGLAGVDGIIGSQPHGATQMREAIQYVNEKIPYDRLIVITDEQATATYSAGRSPGLIPDPIGSKGYMINVASAENGVGYGAWNHIDGFSENVIRWIIENEKTVDVVLSPVGAEDTNQD